MDKAAFRVQARIRRKALASAAPLAGEDVVRSYGRAGLPIPSGAALYVRQGSEIDPQPLALWLAAQGVEIALPVVVEAGQPLSFRRLGDALCADAFGLPCPMPHEPLVTPGLIVAPLLAFDGRGHRLGQGGGFYDRTLAAQRRRLPPPLIIGLAYAGQQVDRLPAEDHDQRLDGVLTERGYLAFL